MLRIFHFFLEYSIFLRIFHFFVEYSIRNCFFGILFFDNITTSFTTTFQPTTNMPYQVTRVWADGRTMDYGNKFNKVGAKDALNSSVKGDERPFSIAETSYAKQIDLMQVGEERKIYPAEEECDDYFLVKFLPGVKRKSDSPAGDLEDEPIEEKRSKFEISPVAWRNVPSGYVGPLACIVSHSTEMIASYKQKRLEVLREYHAYEKTISQNKGLGDLSQFSILAHKIKDSEAVYFRDVREFVRQMIRGQDMGGAISLDEICARTYLHRDEVHAFVLEEAISILFNLGDFMPDDLRWIFELMTELKRASENYELNRFEAEFDKLSAECLLDARVVEQLPGMLDMLPSFDFLWNAVPISEPFSEAKLAILELLMQRMKMGKAAFIEHLQEESYTDKHIEYFVFHGDQYDYPVHYDTIVQFYESKNQAEQRRFLQMKVARFPGMAQELADFECSLKSFPV